VAFLKGKVNYNYIKIDDTVISYYS